MKSTQTSLFRPTPRAWAFWLGKALFSGLLCWLALRNVTLASIRDALATANLPWASLSILTFMVGLMIFEPLRLAVAGRLPMETQPTLVRWFTVSLESRAFFYLLPAGIGQEGYLWWKLRRQGWSHGSCAFLVLVVRMTGLVFWIFALVWALRAPVFRGASSSLLPGALASPQLWFAGASLLGVATLALPWVSARLGKVQPRPFSPWPWVGLALASAGTLLVCMLSFRFGAKAFSIPMPLDQAAGCLGLLFMAMALPVSLAGLGLQEGILLLVGKGLGIPPGPMLGFSCLLHLQRLAPALLGLVVLCLPDLQGAHPSRPGQTPS